MTLSMLRFCSNLACWFIVTFPRFFSTVSSKFPPPPSQIFFRKFSHKNNSIQMLGLCSNLACFFFMNCRFLFRKIFSTMHTPLDLKIFSQANFFTFVEAPGLRKFFWANFSHLCPRPLDLEFFFSAKKFILCPRPLDLEKNFDNKFLQFAPCSYRKFLPHYSVKKRPYPISKSLRLKKSSPLSATICFKRGHIKQQCRPY